MSVIPKFLKLTKQGCELIIPFIKKVYELNRKAAEAGAESGVSKLKPDKTAFTIADGIVQHLLTQVLFLEEKMPNTFKAIVGEEKNKVNITTLPYQVDDLVVPTELNGIVSETLKSLNDVSKEIELLLFSETSFFGEITLFIDPIDGTKQFVTGKGEMCSVMVALVRHDHPVGGLILRPLDTHKSYAMGSKEAKFFEMSHENTLGDYLNEKFDSSSTLLMRSASSYSEFLDTLTEKLGAIQIRVSGAGNKILKIIEFSEYFKCKALYVQDRGISRWDSAAGEAILDSYGGGFLKLSELIKPNDFSSTLPLRYHYRHTLVQAEEDIDWSIKVRMTKSNVNDSSLVKSSKATYFTDETKANMLPYSNMCGLFASIDCSKEALIDFSAKAKEAAKHSKPSYS